MTSQPITKNPLQPPLTMDQAQRQADSHSGDFVAMSVSRDQVYAFASTLQDLEQALKAISIDPATVIISRVEPGQNLGAGLKLDDTSVN